MKAFLERLINQAQRFNQTQTDIGPIYALGPLAKLFILAQLIINNLAKLINLKQQFTTDIIVLNQFEHGSKPLRGWALKTLSMEIDC